MPWAGPSSSNNRSNTNRLSRRAGTTLFCRNRSSCCCCCCCCWCDCLNVVRCNLCSTVRSLIRFVCDWHQQKLTIVYRFVWIILFVWYLSGFGIVHATASSSCQAFNFVRLPVRHNNNTQRTDGLSLITCTGEFCLSLPLFFPPSSSSSCSLFSCLFVSTVLSKKN